MALRTRLFTTLTLLSMALVSFGQVKAVEKFLKQNKDLQKYYIYQSTLRMLNQNGDDDFNRLIKDVRKINLYVAEGNADVPAQSYQRMIRDLSTEQFETLISAKNGSMHINLMSRESGNDAYYVLAGFEEDDFILLEMDGQLDLRYLKALEHVDFNELRKIAGINETPPKHRDEGD